MKDVKSQFFGVSGYMKHFKRFTDFCAGLSAVMVAISLLGKFIGYNPENTEGMLEKLKLFFAEDNIHRNRYQLILIIFLALSFVVSRVFERLPYVTMAVSVLPLIQTFFVFADRRFEDYACLHMIFAVLHTAGIFVYALALDRADGRRRAYWAVNLFELCVSLYVIPIVRSISALADIDETEKFHLSPFESKLYTGIENGADKILIKIALMIAIAVLISILLKDIYFIDAALGIVPLVYSLYVFSFEKLKLFGLESFLIVSICFIFRIAIMIFEPMGRKKQKTPENI